MAGIACLLVTRQISAGEVSSSSADDTLRDAEQGCRKTLPPPLERTGIQDPVTRPGLVVVQDHLLPKRRRRACASKALRSRGERFSKWSTSSLSSPRLCCCAPSGANRGGLATIGLDQTPPASASSA